MKNGDLIMLTFIDKFQKEISMVNFDTFFIHRVLTHELSHLSPLNFCFFVKQYIKKHFLDNKQRSPKNIIIDLFHLAELWGLITLDGISGLFRL